MKKTFFHQKTSRGKKIVKKNLKQKVVHQKNDRMALVSNCTTTLS